MWCLTGIVYSGQPNDVGKTQSGETILQVNDSLLMRRRRRIADLCFVHFTLLMILDNDLHS